ncbi:MAG: pyridoxal 5'-phosphate synthase glutaminase subunit PdxT [Chloroflexi bacterium HGW-Chloroflexi-2]|jgi:5'-phosphate synthase pdxT subunit|nr:MAG: pyridoxal 5'-phosphate synthase glutaminase subunit PdxT [Chloroflexi bacterium HGW-Chloroflexi-2]
MRIGILALQGAFIEHEKMLKNLGVETQQVRLSQHLNDLDGLIIPGGESTTITKLAIDFGLFDDLKAFASEHPVWGTCAGAILLAKDDQSNPPRLDVMDIQIVRNAFGRQVDSFQADLQVPSLAHLNGSNPTYPAVFIRAPIINTVGKKVEILARLGFDKIVAARQGHLLATVFHPELTNDDRFHRYFLEMIPSK